jgi:hypothetical protein
MVTRMPRGAHEVTGRLERTGFADVAGYEGAKLEIREVVISSSARNAMHAPARQHLVGF